MSDWNLPAPLILASRSPRRIELARRMGLDFSVLPADIDEIQRPDESAEAFAERAAVEKAEAVAVRHPDSLTIGCDTIVVLGDTVLGKPAGPAEARAMLAHLAGRTHRVLSGLALLSPARNLRLSGVESTEVEFRDLAPAEIDAYVRSGEPMDKAGAYAIQGGAAAFVTAYRGSYDNVVGLPTERLENFLRRAVRLS